MSKPTRTGPSCPAAQLPCTHQGFQLALADGSHILGHALECATQALEGRRQLAAPPTRPSRRAAHATGQAQRCRGRLVPLCAVVMVQRGRQAIGSTESGMPSAPGHAHRQASPITPGSLAEMQPQRSAAWVSPDSPHLPASREVGLTGVAPGEARSSTLLPASSSSSAIDATTSVGAVCRPCQLPELANSWNPQLSLLPRCTPPARRGTAAAYHTPVPDAKASSSWRSSGASAGASPASLRCCSFSQAAWQARGSRDQS